MAGRSCYRDVLPFAAMVTVESTNVGLNILFKSATTKGLSYYVFIVYSYAFATVLLLPLPFIFPSRTSLPPLNFSLLFKAFLLGLIGFVANICAYKGIDYSSPTLASAMSNLTPAFTFILAVIFRSLLDRLFCSLPCFLNSLLHSLRRLNRRKERVKVGSAAVGCLRYRGWVENEYKISPSTSTTSGFRVEAINLLLSLVNLTRFYAKKYWYRLSAAVPLSVTQYYLAFPFCFRFWEQFAVRFLESFGSRVCNAKRYM